MTMDYKDVIKLAENWLEEYGNEEEAAEDLKAWRGLRAWTTEPPTETGWYWAWDGKYRYAVVKIEYSIMGYVMTSFQGDPPAAYRKELEADRLLLSLERTFTCS